MPAPALAGKLRTWLSEAAQWNPPAESNEFSRFVEWARARLAYLERSVAADGIAEMLRERELFPETDSLIDPAEDLIEE
jgi:hypothetical protein